MKFNFSKITTALLGASLSATTLANTDNSNDDAITETIEVRGNYHGAKKANSFKTDTLLIDTPTSLTMISRQQIDDQNFMDIADILLYTPGVSVGQGENHRDQFTIRGQNTTADFFVDGMRDDVQYFRPLYNLERVEILRGSNAMLFGRGGGGGVINRVTKTAKVGESFNQINANINTFGSAMIAADNNIEIDNNQALRINTLYEEFDNHRDFNHGDRLAVNPTFTWEASDDTSVLLSYEYVNDERFVDRGVPAVNNRPLTGYRDTFFGDQDVNITRFEAHIARARIDHRLSDNWKLDATLQMADYDKFYANTYPIGFNDNGEIGFDGYNDTQDRNNLLAQFNIVGEFSTGSIEHTLLIGGEFGDQRTSNNRNEADFPNGPQSGNLPFRPRDWVALTDPIIAPEVNFINAARDVRSTVEYRSFFIQDEISLSDNWSIVAGLRYDSFDIDVTDFIQVGIDNGSIAPETVFSSEQYAAVANDGNNGFLGRSDNEVSPRVGVIYEAAEHLSFYASFSQSFLPRSGDQFLTLNLTSESLGPEEFENRELGVKWDILPTLSFTAAVFELQRESGSAVNPNNPEATILVGTETRGFEFQLVGYLTDDWSINAGYSFLDAEQVGNVEGTEINNATLAQVPEEMASLWTRYNTSETLGFGLGITHQGAQYATLSNTTELPSFTRVDAAVFYTVDEDLDVQLNVENLFDKEYFPAAHNNHNITTGEPLNARVSVNYRF